MKKRYRYRSAITGRFVTAKCVAVSVSPVAAGTAASGTGKVLYKGEVTPNISISTGVTPKLTTSTAITED